MKGNTIPVSTDINISVCIFNYIKIKNVKVGLMIACKIGDDKSVYIGWSKCHDHDMFDQQAAFDLALFRAYANKLAKQPYTGKEITIPDYLEFPNSIEHNMYKFLKRATNYFKLNVSPFESLMESFVNELSDEKFPMGFVTSMSQRNDSLFGGMLNMYSILRKHDGLGCINFNCKS